MSVSVLQLDTQFPRIPGDVASELTYRCELEIIRIPSASVGSIVSNRPELIDIAPFESALQQAKGDIIVTSCGFLSYWQHHLSAQTTRPFISSALVAFDKLSHQYTPAEVLTITFDQSSLTEQHFGEYAQYANEVVGLPNELHLKQVILEDRIALDEERARQEFNAFVTSKIQPQHTHILLECTNLPPYKKQLHEQTNLPITDILTCIETQQPGAIRPDYLS